MTITQCADVILKLGRKGEVTSEVPASSVALRFASPVFEAMFSGRFAEGQKPSSDCPCEVSLPDDNPQSILLICIIAHHRTAELPKRLDPISFADLAVACDTYQCSEAVQAWAKVWLTTLLNTPSSAHFEKVLFATYVLDLPHEFAKATLVFIRDRSSNINIQHVTHGHNFIPMIVFDKLLCEKRRCENGGYMALYAATSGLGVCDGGKKLIGRRREETDWQHDRRASKCASMAPWNFVTQSDESAS